jgi:ubiquinone/menaquinone biosynthesis C-methylase UbiE
MVNLKNYDKTEDFNHHRIEFENAYEIIQRHTSLEGKIILDLCSGTGMHSGFLLQKDPKFVYGVDLLDYETLWGGRFKQNLVEMYESFGLEFNKDKLQFIRMNAQELFFKDELFDFVYCINAFEHIGDPLLSLLEVHRVLKKGGHAFIQFDPLFSCDTGGHMFDFIPEPWGHLIYSTDDYVKKLKAEGCPLEMINDFIYGLNRFKKKYFLTIFRITTEGELKLFEKMESYEWAGVVKQEHLSHKNFQVLRKIYSQEDLLSRGMNILIQKI